MLHDLDDPNDEARNKIKGFHKKYNSDKELPPFLTDSPYGEIILGTYKCLPPPDSYTP